jgi:O-antigen/teichoic acid export membrane protein
VFVRPVIAVMTTAEFHPAADVVPIILAAYVVQSWGEVTHFGIGVSERTKYFSYVTWIAVAVVMGLYALLIPPLGGYGAALATLAAFVVRFWVGYYWSQRLWPVAYRWPKNLLLAAYGAAATFAAYSVPARGIVWQVGLGSGLMLVYAALALATVVEPEDRRRGIQFLRAPRLGSLFHT